MDSFTQIALGAAVGEAYLGRKVGNKAMLWGGAIGLLPDLDVAAYPLLDEVGKLAFHRGISHSVTFTLLAAPVIGWIIWKIHKKQPVKWHQWSILAALAIGTHILLDCFTVYGTQVWQPFNDLRVQWNSIAIIDPLYSVPLLLGLILAFRLKKSLSRRRLYNYLGIGLSTLYLLTAIGFKIHANSVFEDALAREGIEYERYITTPTLFNSLLWRVTAQTEDGFYTAYYSLLDTNDDVRFSYIPQNRELIEPHMATRVVERLIWFSDGWWSANVNDGKIQFHDLRFGQLDFNGKPGASFVFSWQLKLSGDTIEMTRAEMDVEDPSSQLKGLWKMIKGT